MNTFLEEVLFGEGSVFDAGGVPVREVVACNADVGVVSGARARRARRTSNRSLRPGNPGQEDVL